MNDQRTEYDPELLWLHKGSSYMAAGDSPIRLPFYIPKANRCYLNILPDGRYEVVDDVEHLAGFATPSVLLHAPIVTLGEKTPEGEQVKAVRETWKEIAKQVQSQQDFLFGFTTEPRAFESFLAATYKVDGFDDVVLTPRSKDRGRDVIARRQGKRAARILEQAKAYQAKRRVTFEQVTAMLGVMWLAKFEYTGSITTTSDFAPTIYKGNEFEGIVPEKLTLRNGQRLRDWLVSLIANQL